METYYYDIRKQVFEYDEVMNNQRRAVIPSGGSSRALKQVIGYGGAPWARSWRLMSIPICRRRNGISINWSAR